MGAACQRPAAAWPAAGRLRRKSRGGSQFVATNGVQLLGVLLLRARTRYW